MDVIAQSTVYGIKYYLAIVNAYSDEKLDWCVENFGETSTSRRQFQKPNERWYASNNYFYFLNEKDYMWFILKWS